MASRIFRSTHPSGILLDNQKRPDGEGNEMIGEKVCEKERINELFDELVPASGKADSVAGELVRAATRIGYRYMNDGDMVDVDYGKETCNAPARYIRTHANADIGKMIDGLWGWCGLESSYEMLVNEMCQAVADYVDANPSLREQPTENMWDHVKDEDYDYGQEDEVEDW